MYEFITLMYVYCIIGSMNNINAKLELSAWWEKEDNSSIGLSYLTSDLTIRMRRHYIIIIHVLKYFNFRYLVDNLLTHEDLPRTRRRASSDIIVNQPANNPETNKKSCCWFQAVIQISAELTMMWLWSLLQHGANRRWMDTDGDYSHSYCHQPMWSIMYKQVDFISTWFSVTTD